MCDHADMEPEDKRARAISVLKSLRALLLHDQQVRPGHQWITPAVHAKSFNEALELVETELGKEWVQAYYYGPDRIIPKSKRKGGSPPVDAVGRDFLLGEIGQVLQRLGVED